VDSLDLPDGVLMIDRGSDWLRFRIENPETANPDLLRRLLDSNWPVLSFQVIPRTLEQAYLAAVGRFEAEQTNA
jgi:hypothetical protein